jgi:hypothetical protein
LHGRGISENSHLTAQGIDLANEIAFGEAANSWVARHFADGIGILGYEKGSGAKTREGEGSLYSGMASAYHDGIEIAHCILS